MYFLIALARQGSWLMYNAIARLGWSTGSAPVIPDVVFAFLKKIWMDETHTSSCDGCGRWNVSVAPSAMCPHLKQLTAAIYIILAVVHRR